MKQTSPQEKVQKILVAARDLFFRQSFEKTTVEEIARAIPMSKATLYSVFQNKEQILLALCEAHCDHLDDMLSQKAASTKSDYLNCFMEMLKMQLSSIYSEASSVETPEGLVYTSGQIRAALADKLVARKKIFLSILEKAIKAKELPKGTNSQHLCEVLLATITSYLPPYNRHFELLDGGQRPRLDVFSKELDSLTKILLEGLRRL